MNFCIPLVRTPCIMKVWLALFIQHAMHMRRIYCNLWPAPLCYISPRYPINGRVFEKINLLHIECVSILSTSFPETFPTVRRNDGDVPGIADSNLLDRMVVRHLCVLRRKRPLRRADHLFRVLPGVYKSVIHKHRHWTDIGMICSFGRTKNLNPDLPFIILT
jgi:hypothetical protein